MILQLLVNGIIAGAIYSLIASGFSLIYSTNKFIHFAHGGVLAVAAYVLYGFFSIVGVGIFISGIMAVIGAVSIGWLMNFFVYRILRKRKASGAILIISSFALLIIIESLIQLFFGADVKTFNYLTIAKGHEIFGAIITPWQIFIIVIAVIFFGLFFFVMKKTRTGQAMRAVADNKEAAEIVGISSEKIYALSFVIGSAIAGLAAILIGIEQNIEPMMGTNLIIKGFTGAVIGGIGSVPGAILGAFFLGIIENIGIWFLPSGYKDAIAFIILFVFLIFRPYGILGLKKN